MGRLLQQLRSTFNYVKATGTLPNDLLQKLFTAAPQD